MGRSAKQATTLPLWNENDEDTKKKSKRSVKPPPSTDNESPEFQALISEMHARDERRASKPKTIAAGVFNRAREDVKEMMETDDWSACSARHLVALYDLMHLKCYGVECIELGPTERYNAVMMAAGLTKRWFGGDSQAVVDFMHWAWTREIGIEKWRRENKKLDGKRIGARLMFGGALVTDYRLYLARGDNRS